MVPRVCPSQPRWVPHVTGSPWLITIIKWRDLREESFPSQARQWPRVIHHNLHHQPPAAWQRQSGAKWRQGDGRERDNVGGIIIIWCSWSSSMWKLPLSHQGILFSHDYHHFALVFAPVPSSRAQANWGPGQGSKVGSTAGTRWYIMMRATRIKLFRMTGAGKTKNILIMQQHKW